jgi:sugar lactone lactonase YvrE
VATTLLSILAFGCLGDDERTPILGCESEPGFEVDCQFQNPEDLAPSPDGRILVSQFGDMDGEAAGNLAIYDPETRVLEVLYPDDAAPARAAESTWGDPDCKPPDPKRFSPHGIDLAQRRDGRHQLAVVNHGGRESVELFEVAADGSLAWRGCVEGPAESYFNDVVVLSNGGFWVTHMFPRGQTVVPLIRARLGMDTGWVYAWDPQGGFTKLPGTDAPFPNGIERSEDERYVYLNTYSTTGVRKVDVSTGEQVAEHLLPSVDNSTWGEDGRLLVASHTGGLGQMIACQQLEEGACGLAFEILALDPEDLGGGVILRHEGAPMGGATVALEREGVLYLGSFKGDRIARVSRSAQLDAE